MMIRSQPRRRGRRALTTVAVLVCLVVISLILAALLKVGLAQRLQVRNQERNLQAEWLAESGIDRALARLAADRNYAGEEWSIGPEDLASPRGPKRDGSGGAPAPLAAKVTIIVDRIAEEPNRRRIRAQADYGLDPPTRSRHTKQVLIDLEPEKTGVAP
jgi:type II secretory pathway pseudopilin PulG